MFSCLGDLPRDGQTSCGAVCGAVSAAEPGLEEKSPWSDFSRSFLLFAFLYISFSSLAVSDKNTQTHARAVESDDGFGKQAPLAVYKRNFKILVCVALTAALLCLRSRWRVQVAVSFHHGLLFMQGHLQELLKITDAADIVPLVTRCVLCKAI